MARNANTKTREVEEYIPDVETNRDDPDPFAVGIEPATATEMAAVERGLADMSGRSNNYIARAQRKVRDLFVAKVKWVRNYTITHRKTGVVIEPKTGAQLFDAIMEHGDDTESKIIDDIVEAIKDCSHLRRGLPEALRSQSGQASSAVTPSKDGAVSAVDEKSGQSPISTST